jgi:LPXTG-motif cell wall-anchored protein
MNKTIKSKTIKLLLTVLLTINIAIAGIPTVAKAAEPTVQLGTAGTYAVLAGSTITNTGPTTITGTKGGDIGLHPGDDPTIVTFPGQEQITTNGTIHLFDAAAEQAKADLLIAYNDAAGRVTTETVSGDLAGRTLTPGVYTSESSMGLTGTLILDGGGDPNAVFIFQAGSSLTLGSGSQVVLINDAQPCKVFWQVGSSATLGTGTNFVGHILAMESITDTTGATIRGQLLALDGAVTLDTNTIINDACLGAGSLRVTKNLVGDVANMALPAFEITVTGPYNYTNTQTIAAGSSYNFEGLSSGTYTVTEKALGEDWNASGTGQYNVTLGTVTNVNVTNTYEESTTTTPTSSVRVLPNTGGTALLIVTAGITLLGVSILLMRKSKKTVQ